MIQSRPNELRPDEPAAGMPGTEPKDRLRQHGEEAKRMAGDAAHQAGDKLREAGRQAKDQISGAACQTTTQMKERASTLLADQKSRLADQGSVFSEALHRAGDTLDQNGDEAIGRYVHQAADMIDTCSRQFRDADAGQMARSCGNFTRRHPEIVLGGLFLAGVALARFLKASDRDRDRREFADLDREYGYMDTGRGLESEDEYGYRDAGYGDVGMYAGSDVEDYAMNEPFGTTGRSTLDPDVTGDADTIPDLPREDASLKPSEDIPDVTSPQPSQSDKAEPAVIRDDDLGTIGRNEPSTTNPNRPR